MSGAGRLKREPTNPPYVVAPAEVVDASAGRAHTGRGFEAGISPRGALFPHAYGQMVWSRVRGNPGSVRVRRRFRTCAISTSHDSRKFTAARSSSSWAAKQNLFRLFGIFFGCRPDNDKQPIPYRATNPQLPVRTEKKNGRDATWGASPTVRIDNDYHSVRCFFHAYAASRILRFGAAPCSSGKM